MKEGDLVQLVGSHSGRIITIGVILGPWRDMPGWLRILVKEEVVQWPENQLRLV